MQQIELIEDASLRILETWNDRRYLESFIPISQIYAK